MTNDLESAKDSVIEFLLGTAPLEGVWYGNRPDGEPHYWWRKHLREYARETEQLRQRVKDLEERLECNHVYNHKGEREEVEPGSIPDGISCRDETIRLLDRNCDALREKLEKAKSCLDWYADEHAYNKHGAPYSMEFREGVDVEELDLGKRARDVLEKLK